MNIFRKKIDITSACEITEISSKLFLYVPPEIKNITKKGTIKVYRSLWYEESSESYTLVDAIEGEQFNDGIRVVYLTRSKSELTKLKLVL